MKICPKCKVKYDDTTLEYCLEDGTRLNFPAATETAAKAKTEIFKGLADALPNDFDVSKETVLQNKATNKIAEIKEKVTYQGYKVIEIAPIVLALAHNYWQWLYLNKTDYGNTISFITSGHFIIWLGLMIVGIITSIIALKYAKNRGFAVASLAILAINLLLSIVPNK